MKNSKKRSCLRRLPKGRGWTQVATTKKKWLVVVPIRAGRHRGHTFNHSYYGPYTKIEAQRAVKRCGKGEVVFGA